MYYLLPFCVYTKILLNQVRSTVYGFYKPMVELRGPGSAVLRRGPSQISGVIWLWKLLVELHEPISNSKLARESMC